MGMGFVARNHLGECLLAGNEQLQGFSEPELAEALAIRRALEVCRSEGCTSILLASDCLTMVNKIKSKAQDRSTVGTVVSDIKSLASWFTHCSFLHVRRGMNVAVTQAVNHFYLGVVSDCIRNDLCCDVQ
ncbi:non-ltr retroelement reverse transcriptase [Hordeum vulgare]|nr:non-ltr retroelement reverse transcriptase [Hordeum vulgare]